MAAGSIGFVLTSEIGLHYLSHHPLPEFRKLRDSQGTWLQTKKDLNRMGFWVTQLIVWGSLEWTAGQLWSVCLQARVQSVWQAMN